MSPRTVIGVPLYNNAGHLPEALESLLLQTHRDFALILVDDVSTDETREVARRYEARDERISYVRNDDRLGMVRNWRRAFELARQRHPEMEYFAWASDHDVWHPRWLGKLVDALDRDPAVAMAYPLRVGIDDSGEVMREPWEFDTRGIANIRERLVQTTDNMAAGDMVYSLFRADALERCGVYRLVLLPDRLLMTQLALYGEFEQVPEPLWFRRFSSDVSPSYARQRASFFPDGAPFYSFLPWFMQHGAASWWSLVVRGNRPVGVSSSEAASFAALNLSLGFRFQMRRWARRRAKAVRSAFFKRTLPALARPIGGDRGYRILAKATNRASDAVHDGDLDPARRAREIVRVASETAVQLQRERARSAANRAQEHSGTSPGKAERAKAKRVRAREKAKRAEAKHL